ncbi:hypothetical protein PVAP13_5KG073187 [Panicum virgatum]|uniref:Uncharacterized protein n=1 Tax=Panicum virgatum TaxID=38727 RepID=A0A8T0SFJ7_PANVG|nr:hypothetical protein PVAP13_5KG073187 [Panicum virgatum]
MGYRLQQGFNTLVVLGKWSIWKTRNDVMFNGAAPRINRALLLAREEAEFWMLAGAKDLRMGDFPLVYSK